MAGRTAKQIAAADAAAKKAIQLFERRERRRAKAAAARYRKAYEAAVALDAERWKKAWAAYSEQNEARLEKVRRQVMAQSTGLTPALYVPRPPKKRTPKKAR